MQCPHRILPGIFEEAFAARLLSYAIENEPAFSPSKIGAAREGAVDPSMRVSLVLRDLGPLEPEIGARLLDVAPALMRQLGVAPFDVARTEIEMVAHRDGAFYRPHVDTSLDDPNDELIRLLSAVYYFNSEPRRYSGGALRLHDMGSNGTNGPFVDIEPAHNSLVMFPSWALHQVMPVHCPSRSFADSRFAINCWFLRKRV